MFSYVFEALLTINIDVVINNYRYRTINEHYLPEIIDNYQQSEVSVYFFLSIHNDFISKKLF